MSKEDINFLISIQDLEQPEFDNACLERNLKNEERYNKELEEKLKRIENYIDKQHDIPIEILINIKNIINSKESDKE